MDNITIIDTNLNSIWVRDYRGTTVYGNEVDNSLLVDWIYNRPRPENDITPAVVASAIGLDIYTEVSKYFIVQELYLKYIAILLYKFGNTT